jgi:hypothetical protein
VATHHAPGRAPAARGRRPPAVVTLVALLVFHGLGAVGGGAFLVADPTGGAIGWDTSLLERTPFSTFLWPGLILGVGLGVSGLVLAVGVWSRPAWTPFAPLERLTGHHWAWAGSLGVGTGLVAWIVVQVLLIDARTPLQPLMAVVGLAIVATTASRPARRYLAAGAAG